MSNTNPTAAQQSVTQKTKSWVKEIVIGLNLCPFASQPFKKETIEYTVCNGDSIEQHLQQLADCFSRLNETNEIETSLLIYPDAYQSFDSYLDFLDYSNALLEDLNYIGIYQVASFHPHYCFEGSTEDDASNFTNRTPYPMLHLIREADLEKAIASYPDIEQVPENNIKKLRDIGYQEIQKKLAQLIK